MRYALRTKRTERQLRASQRNRARAQQIARQAQWSKDLLADTCHCSPDMRDMVGQSGSGGVDLAQILAMLVDDNRAAFVEFFERLSRGVGQLQVEVRVGTQARGA